jgi:hypothetical protein
MNDIASFFLLAVESAVSVPDAPRVVNYSESARQAPLGQRPQWLQAYGFVIGQRSPNAV